MALPQIIADFETALSAAISIGATSFTISSALDDDGVSLPAGTYYFTVDNGSSVKEYLTGTLSGTTISSVKSVSRQGVETVGAARAHRVGAPCIITDFNTFKKYIDGIALAGSATATPSTLGISQLSAVASAPAAPVVLVANDPSIFPNAYGVDAGSNDTYVITLTTAPAAYATGQVYAFKANTVNTGAATLNINSLGAKSIVRSDGAALADGDIAAGQIVEVIYDGTNMRLTGPRGGATATKQTFTASGTYTAPTGLRFAVVDIQGVGGAGSSDNVGGAGASSGGGGGGFVRKQFLAATIGASQTITLGAAGTPGVNGTNTTFGALLTAGGGGSAAAGGPGAAGAASGGDLNIPGQPGNPCPAASSSAGLGGGGGNAFMGLGGPGVRNTNAVATADGAAGTNYGGGGAGGVSASDGSPAGGNGGNGAGGIVIVYEYY